MRTKKITSLLRQIRPKTGDGWAQSARGRQVLEGVLGTSRTAPASTTVTRGRRSPRTLAVGAALAAALVTAAVLVGPQLLGDRTLSPLAAMDNYRPADVAFFDHLKVGPAVEEAHHYQTLQEGAAAATAVVVADVVDVHATRVIVGEVPADRLHMIGVTIRPAEVVSGILPDPDAELTVEFPTGSADPADQIAQMKQTMPEGRSVWFLVSNAESVERAKSTLAEQGKTPTPQQLEVWEAAKPYYGIINSQGIYIQGEQHAIDPIAQPEAGREGMIHQAQTSPKLSGLVSQLRTSR